MKEQNRKFVIRIQGKEIEVSEEVFRAYVRPIAAERRRARKDRKCRLLSETGGYYVRCKKHCENCEYYLSGKNTTAKPLSIERMEENGVYIEDKNQNIENEPKREEYEKLCKSIAQLTKRQQEFVKLIYFEGKTQEEVWKKYGIAKSSMSEAMKRIYAALKIFFITTNFCKFKSFYLCRRLRKRYKTVERVSKMTLEQIRKDLNLVR